MEGVRKTAEMKEKKTKRGDDKEEENQADHEQ